MFREFKKFAIKGSVIDLAIGIIIGSAFGNLVKSLVDDLIMPPVGLLLNGVDFSNIFIILKEGVSPKPYASLSIAQETGAVTMNIGVFINTLISFFIVSFVVFLLVKAVNKVRREDEEPKPPATKKCPLCFSEVHAEAVRCPHCTSEIQ
jgi:large conductance mechanosensitive channel